MKRVLFISVLCLLAVTGVQAQKPTQPSWLSDAVFYQIYPSSFQDSDGDGYGDLKGIMSRLDYIKSIGVTAIWLNPVYVSGWTDGGYDVIDFYRVDKRFGTNSDLVELVRQAHERGIKVVMDLVAGHSSDQNEWFLQSREAPDLRYSDYYIWPDFKPEEPAQSGPMDYAALMNSRTSLLRKFVATDAPRGPYYVKNFFDTQPALNFGFANPDPEHPWEQAVDAPGPMAMRRELKNIISFWMDKGVDGFRVDMAASLVKNDFDKSATIKLWKDDFTKWFDKKYPEGILIAEWFNPAQSVAAADFDLDFFCHDGQYNYSTLFFYGRRGFGPNATPTVPYFDKSGAGDLRTWYDLYAYQYNAVKGKGYVSMPSGNHDFNRVCTEGRTTPDELKVAMTFFLTMPGVPFIYYGDEIGLKQNPDAPSTDGSGGRAGCRIPMLWDGTANGGFSTAPIEKIYIPQDPDPDRMTVEKEENDPTSLLNYVRTLLKLRKEVKALGADADWRLVSSLDQPYPMVYERKLGQERCYVVLNPSGKQVSVTLPAEPSKPQIIAGNYKKCTYKQTRKGDVITLSPVSAAILSFETIHTGARPRQPQIVSRADRSTVEFVVRDGEPLLMDIYQFRDRETEGKRPVFIYSFGGAWAMGSRVDALCNPLYDHLCEKGWVCVAIDYRLGAARGRDGKPLITPPEGYNPFQFAIDLGVEDIYAATAWLIKHADEYNIDPDKIVISGSSAGAINSMNAEYYLCTGHKIARENLPDGFNYAGVIPMAGAVYLTGENDTELKWDKKPCPMCFFHGSADPTVTFDMERSPNRHGFGPLYVSRQLDAMDVPYMLNEYSEGDHCMALLPLKWFWNEIDSFLDRIVLGGQNIKAHAIERSDKPRTDANWLDTVRPGQYQAVNRMRGRR